ncbi:hydrogenase-4 component F [Candidatus Magnetobacterium bavaricum]|uniref:Hydrogenase-4 component F n=1 Tax=Candidatus Magnetobacterium bavaricum TaxID=29290 RepID=A0A0F3GQE4_9BACT|nr:hydrogenase-4 component F [Candidatus Magnetobacterium bavaricum]
MQELALIMAQFVLALVSFLKKSGGWDKAIMLIAAVFHMTVTLYLCIRGSVSAAILGADSLGCLFLLILSTLFGATTISSTPFIKYTEYGYFNYRYVIFMLLLLGALTGVILSRNIGLMWVFAVAATLASAPLVWHYGDRESLEVVWKYTFICAVGLALAFVGVLAILEGAREIAGASLSVDLLAGRATLISPKWGRIAIAFALVGYATQMGMAPMHAWLADVHVQAPSPVAAFFSGAMVSAALLAILRYYQIFAATPLIVDFREVLLAIGPLSILVGAVHILKVDNFKRKLAACNIQHMGILCVGMALGGGAVYATVLYALSYPLAKHLMLLTSGNFLRAYGTINTSEISGGLGSMPKSSWLLMVGVFVLVGLLPSGVFIGEFMLFKRMVTYPLWVLLIVSLIPMTIVAYAIIEATLRITLSHSAAPVFTQEAEPLVCHAPQWVFIALLVLMALHLPQRLDVLIRGAASLLGGF